MASITLPTRSWTTRGPVSASEAGSTIRTQSGGHLAVRHFAIRRIRGDGDFWVGEVISTNDGVPTRAVSIMEFVGDAVSVGGTRVHDRHGRGRARLAPVPRLWPSDQR